MIDGYKESPLGKIPKNWEIVSVKEITKEHKQGFYTKDSYTNDGIRLARITDLNNPKVVFSEMPMLNISDSDYQNYKIEKGDFLFARSGAIGRYGIVEDEEYPAVFASYLIRFRFNNNIVNRYFGYFFESYLCNNQLRGITQGNANVNINAENIKSLKFPLAPFGEQQKIAEILSTVDEKIEVIDQQITETQELKKGLMQRLLTKGIGHTEFKDSPLGRIPESWEVVKFEDILRKGKGSLGYGILQPGEGVSQGINMVRTVDLTEVGRANTKILKVPENISNTSPTTVLEGGEVLLSVMGTLGRTFLVPNEWRGWNVNRALAVIRTNEKIDNNFLCHFFRSPYFKRVIDKQSLGSAQIRINLNDLRKYDVPLPSLCEQIHISSNLSLFDDKLEVLLEKKTHYQELKQGLMQQLLTGKIRVKV